MSWLGDDLDELPGPDVAAGDAVRARAAEILRPAGAFARLDAVAVWVAEWQRILHPAVRRPAALIFAADHGVAAAGVSKYPSEVTAAMLAAFGAGRSTVSALAGVAGAQVRAIDVGVGRPTGDIRHEPALSVERATQIAATARDAVDALDADLLVLGEMGIGNTTAASAVCAALLGGSPADWVGRGTGVDDDGLSRKIAAVDAAVTRFSGTSDPLGALTEIGGSELVAIAAAVVAARRRRLPVVLDGFVVTAAVLPLALARPGALDHCLAGHRSAEAAHGRLLRQLGLEPLVDLGLRLGEGSGAMAVVPLVAMACAAVVGVPTFAEWFGS